MKAKKGVNTKWANLVVCSVQGRNARWRERGWKQTDKHKRDKWERIPRTRQRNEAIGIPELAMNSMRLSYRSSYDGLRPPIIGQTASHLSSASGWEMLHVVTEQRRSGWYVTSLGAARLFTSVLKNSQHSWIVDTKHSLFLVLCRDACLTHTQSISSQQSVLWKACVHHETMKRNLLI